MLKNNDFISLERQLWAEGNAKNSQFWHVMADKLFEVVEHADSFRSSN